MKIYVKGTGETAKTARMLLMKAGFAIIESPYADYQVEIVDTATAGDMILFDSIDSELEREIMRDVRRRSPEAVIAIASSGDRDERKLKITVPNMPAARQAVELGVLQGFSEAFAKKTISPVPPPPPPAEPTPEPRPNFLRKFFTRKTR